MSTTKRDHSFTEEKENEKQNNNVKKMKKADDDQQNIRLRIVEEFRNRNLEVPYEMIDTIDGTVPNKTNKSDVERRKELYLYLAQYLDHRKVRRHGETYIYPTLIQDLIRCRFSNDIRAYPSVKTVKHGKLNKVTEEKKHYVQWEDFCKRIG